MEYSKLGSSDLNVSKIGLGCMSFGDPASLMHEWTLNPTESEKIIQHALELGINFFDTANSYSNGTSEEYLAQALKKYISREQIILATKVYFNEGFLSKKAIETEINGSLKRLQTDYIDLYIIHRFDYTTPMEETMETLNQLVKSGKVRALGASAMYGYQFFNLQLIAQQNGWSPFVSMQNHYNLLYREDERELIPVCRQFDVALTPYSPLAAGRLSRTDWKTETLRSQTDKVAIAKYDHTQERDRAIVGRVYELSQKYNVTMTQVALAWQFLKGVTAPIIGATKTSYLDDAVGAFKIKLTDEDAQYLEELYIPHRISGAR